MRIGVPNRAEQLGRMKRSLLRQIVLLGMFAVLAMTASRATANSFDTSTWTKPFPPYRIAGNLYYVGSEDLASFLVVTPQGNILINSSLESSPELIKESIEKLGFKFSDTKIL